MTRGARLAGGAAWNVGGKAFQFLVGLVAVAVIGRWVGPQAYGVFALAWVGVGLFEIVVSSAPAEALVQRTELRPGHRDATFLWCTALAVIAWAGIAFAAGPLAAALGGGAALAAILPLRAASLPLAALATVPTAMLMREERFKAIAGAEAVAGVVSSLVGIGAALWGAGIWSLVAMELVRQALSTAVLCRQARWRPGLSATLEDARDLIGFNLRTLGAWGTTFVETQLPRLLIGHALGAQALGFWALAHRLYDQASAVLTVPAYQAVLAGVSRAQGDRAAVLRLVEGVLRGAALITCPVFLGLAAIAPVLVPAVFGPQWEDAVPVVQVLMLLGVRASSFMVQMAVVRALGRTDLHLAASIGGLALTALLCWIAVPHGIVATAAAVVVRALLMWVPYAVFVNRLTGLGAGAQARAAAGPLAAGVAMFAGTLPAVLALDAALPPLAALALGVACGALLYAGALAVLARRAFSFAAQVLGRVLRRDRAGLQRLFGAA